MAPGGPLYDIDAQWHVAFLTTHLAWAVSEFGFLRTANARTANGVPRPWSFLLVPASLVASLIITHAYPDGRIPGPPSVLLSASLVLTWVGIGIRLWILHVRQGRGAALLGEPSVGGLHRWIRHPAYTGALTSLVGIALGYGNALSLCVVTVTAALFFARLMHAPPRQAEPVSRPSRRRWQILPFIW